MAADGDELADDREPQDDEAIYINEADGLSRVAAHDEAEPETAAGAPVSPAAPRALIVTGVRADVFESDELRAQLEALCRAVDADVAFHWLRSFRRLRVAYNSHEAAAAARQLLHRRPFPPEPDSPDAPQLGCYFAQPLTPASAPNLQPPKATKQFLISPPASPPLGWQPRAENEPLVNHDLLAALAALAPGDCRELLPPQGSQPAIIVHAAHAAAQAAAAHPSPAAQPSDCQ